MTIDRDTALLLIDIQQGLDDPKYGFRNNPEAEQRIADLLERWRAAQRLHRAALASLHGEFAAVRTTSEVLAELQRQP